MNQKIAGIGVGMGIMLAASAVAVRAQNSPTGAGIDAALDRGTQVGTKNMAATTSLASVGILDGDSFDIEIDGGVVNVDVLITIEGCPLKDRITSDVTAAVSPLEGVDRVTVSLSPMTQEQRQALVQQLRGGGSSAPQQQSAISFPATTSIVAIASGKGGVGKTWVSVTLVHALSRAGRKALLFDGDQPSPATKAILEKRVAGPSGDRWETLTSFPVIAGECK